MIVLNTQILLKTGAETHVGSAIGQTFKEYSLSILIEVYSFSFAIFLLGLNGYHTFLIFTGQTTNEQIKNAWKLPSGNPYRL